MQSNVFAPNQNRGSEPSPKNTMKKIELGRGAAWQRGWETERTLHEQWSARGLFVPPLKDALNPKP